MMAYTSMEIFDNWSDPNFKFFVNREGGIKERMDFLMKDRRVEDEYLGACLDYIRWGGQTTVMYGLETKGLINFVQHWMDLNQDNLIWGDKEHSKDFTLPYIKHNKCPRDEKHKGTIKDLAGRVRCIHKSEKRLKLSFIENYKIFDEHSQMDKTNYFEIEPRDTLPDDAWDENTGELLNFYKEEWKEYQEQMEKFEEEKPTVIVKDFCYAILSDENVIFSLEEVLDRLNLELRMRTVYCSGIECKRLDEIPEDEKWLYEHGMCMGHEEENDKTIHPFDGWTLALYVQKWYEQVLNGRVPVWKKDKIKNFGT